MNAVAPLSRPPRSSQSKEVYYWAINPPSRPWNEAREDLIRSLFDKNGKGLEIGPSYNPIAAKRLGYDVDVLDHVDTETLRAKYAREGNIDPGRIEEVDFVWTGGLLSEVVGATGAYDYVVASHVIEHTPDMLGFLNECAKLLKPDGRLVLAIPDMRRCFDAFRPLSSTGQVLQAHTDRRQSHSPATAWDHIAYMANLDGRAGWTKGDRGRLAPAKDLTFARKLFDRALSDPTYHDFHAWVFTPSSFRLIAADLHAAGYTELRETDFRLTDGFEFLAVLTKSGPGCPLSRDDLLFRARQELTELPRLPA
jgi:SAM-dependent methyltransferase